MLKFKRRLVIIYAGIKLFLLKLITKKLVTLYRTYFMPLIELTAKGLFCSVGNFYIDPWRPVDYAVITHAHSDHARAGHRHYLCHTLTRPLIQHRLGYHHTIDVLEYNEVISRHGVSIKFLPAGHIIGSAQIIVSYRGEIWAVTGDYKTEEDPLAGQFEPQRCHALITECTFGLPIYRWQPQHELFSEINNWWSNNASQHTPSVVFAYSLGKAQRLLQGLDLSIGSVYTHGAVEATNEVLRQHGVPLATTLHLDSGVPLKSLQKALIIAPPSALSSPWMKKLDNSATAVTSGWMAVRGNRRRHGVDRGFALSDHADWQGLAQTVKSSQAEKIYTTHGFTVSFTRWLEEQGYASEVLKTHFQGELDDVEQTEI